MDEKAVLERRLSITQTQLMNALARVAELEALITLSQEGASND